jgi:hypothetical protein
VKNRAFANFDVVGNKQHSCAVLAHGDFNGPSWLRGIARFAEICTLMHGRRMSEDGGGG